jgi:hypothetical protein
MGGAHVAEAAFDTDDHHVAGHLAGDAGACDRRPGDDLPVAGVDGEENPDDSSVPATQLEMIRAPPDI